MNQFTLHGLEFSQFKDYFGKTDAELSALGIMRVKATKPNAFPCRVSLQDAEVSEVLLLLPFVHHSAESPYRASGPIYVREHAKPAKMAPGVVPEYVSRRLISLRAYNAKHLMVDASVNEGQDVAERLKELFANPKVDYVHLHNAIPGCYSCMATRSD